MTNGAYTLGTGQAAKAFERVAETTQLDERNVGITIGNGISPPYPPERLAATMEMNGTHAVAIKKKAQREVGFGFGIVPHDRVDSPNDSEKDVVEDFWYGRDSIWKIGPKGTPTTSPTEVFEQARQDYRAIGWLAIELIYTADDRLAGLAHLPARTVRVRKNTEDGERQAGHGYVQKLDGKTRFFAEAGDRVRETVDGNDNSIFVDKVSGEVTRERPENPANEILFIPNPHPNALYYGIPAWVSEIETIVGDHEARRFNREFFEWDAMGQYFVIVEGGELTESSRKDVRDLIKGLRENDGRRVAVLEATELVDESRVAPHAGNDVSDVTIKVEQIQTHSEEDQAFTEYRKRNEHDIAKVHEMPPQLIGVMENSNRSNIKEAVRDFTKEVIEPAQERFAGRLYRIIHQQILGVEDWTLEFETRGAENEREEAEIASIILGSVGPATTVREARELVGLEGQPDWMGDAVANSYLSELQGTPSPGEALETALAETEAEAIARATAQTRIQNGAVADSEASA